jgi:hypothetical protein
MFLLAWKLGAEILVYKTIGFQVREELGKIQLSDGGVCYG